MNSEDEEDEENDDEYDEEVSADYGDESIDETPKPNSKSIIKTSTEPKFKPAVII